MKHLTKWLTIVLGALSLCVSAHAQTAPDCYFALTATATGRSNAYDNRGLGATPVCTTWHFSYFNDGFSAVSVELDEAPSVGGAPGAWTLWPNVVSGSLPLTATTQGQVTLYKYFPWVSINVTTATGTGTLRIMAYGFKPYVTNDVNASPSSSVPNPLPVSGSIGTALVQDGAGRLQTTVASSGQLATGQASNSFLQTGASLQPTNVALWVYNGATWDYQFYCPNSATFSVASTITQVVALSGATKIRVCSFDLNPSTITAGSADLVYGTGTNCGTGTTTLSGAYTLPASAVVDITPATLGPGGALITPAGQAVCVRAVTSTVNGFITWAQF